MSPSRLAACIALAALTGGAGAAESTESIRIHADLTEAPRRILHGRLAMPVEPGPLTLHYPQWIPGEHGPTGPVADLVGIRMSAGGETVAWQRDADDMFTFHLDVPEGAATLDIELDYLAPSDSGGFTAGPNTSDRVAVLSWNSLLLYPAGSAGDDLVYEPSLSLPEGWSYGTALRTRQVESGRIAFEAVSLTTLIDSPVAAGEHHRLIDLGVADGAPHRLHIVADSAEALVIGEDFETGLRGLVTESLALFGARHYRSYDFLLTLSDHVAHFGLEHHESSDNRLAERVFLDELTRYDAVDLFSHEFVHSWNAKYRRPAGLTAPEYQTPTVGDLLWVYEGLTSYLGEIVTPRSGLWTPEYFREYLALTAAYLDHKPGRTWRPLGDTARGARVTFRTRSEWSSWRRGVDFYPEGILLWLEADVLIRELTNGERSLDDFCRRFHGGESGGPEVVPFTYEELLADLAAIADHDWDGFFQERIHEVQARPPLAGINRGGWRIEYTDEMNDQLASYEERALTTDHTFSLGFQVFTKPRHPKHGYIKDVVPGMPAAEAGLAPAMTLVAVNGRRWTPDVLRDALVAAAAGDGKIALLVENSDFYTELEVSYDGGPRYPHLVRDETAPDLLGAIIAPRVRRP